MAENDKKPPKGSKTSASKKVLNLWQRINAVRAEVTSVAKDKVVGDGSYAYKVATSEVIREMLRPLMAKHGLVDWIQETGYERVDTGLTRGKQQAKLIRHEGKYIYYIRNVDDPEDEHTFFTRGDGEDSGDKGPGKASTYALKMAQKILFCISADEREEDVIPPEELESQAVQTLIPQHVDQVLQLADELFGDNADKELNLMSHKLYGVDEARLIPIDQFGSAVTNLQNKADWYKKKAEKDAAAADNAEKPEVSETDSRPESESL